MTLIQVTAADGSVKEIDSNEEVLVHGVDESGLYLGLVPRGTASEADNAPAHPNSVWFPETKTWVRQITLDEAKRSRRELINRYRDAAEFGTFTWDGSAFDCDPESRNKIMGVVVRAVLAMNTSTPFEEQWTLADNTVRTLSAEDIVQIGMTLAAHVSSVHAISRTLKSQIEAAQTIEEVNAVDWP